MNTRSRILIIDDDPMLRSLVLSVLRKNYIVSVAANGEEGYKKAREHRPDLTILDIHMDGWDGLKTLQEFRKDSTLANKKCMVLSADNSRETVLAAIRAGADDYLLKTGFDKQLFLQKVAQLLVPDFLKHRATKPIASSASEQPHSSTSDTQSAEADDAEKSLANKEVVSPQTSTAVLEEPADESLPQEHLDHAQIEEQLEDIMDEWD